ncbi:MAG: exosome complex RNA-binding protein Csl4 [Candidatus Hydrothermarchaeaceae archaeon]
MSSEVGLIRPRKVNKMVESGDFVLPGKEVGFSEEFIPGEGTYEEEGKIFASSTGLVTVDLNERKITVASKTSVPIVLKDGDKVIGVVANLRPQVGVVDIIKLLGNGRGLPGKISAGIHISKLRDSYVSEISKEIGVGDIIIAKVVNVNRRPMDISLVDKDLGVIKSYCEKCSTPLVLTDKKLMCNKCNRPVYKKLSTEYGKGQV